MIYRQNILQFDGDNFKNFHTEECTLTVDNPDFQPGQEVMMFDGEPVPLQHRDLYFK